MLMLIKRMTAALVAVALGGCDQQRIEQLEEGP